jgi:exopolysaccharide biosynthesis polyprenyl glycosylphosphotransferase
VSHDVAADTAARPRRSAFPSNVGVERSEAAETLGRWDSGNYPARMLKAWMLVLPVDGLMLIAPITWMPGHFKAFLLMTAVGLVMLRGSAPYRARLHLSVLDELPVLLGRLLIAGAIVATAFALQHETNEVVVFLVTALSSVGLVVVGRVVTTHILLWGRQHRIVAHPTVIVGGADVGREVALILERYPRYGLHVIGYVSDEQAARETMPVPCLGRLGDLDELVLSQFVDVVLIADGDLAESSVRDLVGRSEIAGADTLVIPRFRHAHIQASNVDHIGSVPVMRLCMPVLEGRGRIAKRALDIVISAIALVALAPVLLVIAVAVRAGGGPGVLFRQERVSQNGEVFSCLKFRTMSPAPEAAATEWSPSTDRRAGRVARLLRGTSLDELPQLWNVLRGDMTLVGPRPERPFFVHKFSAEHPRYSARHRVRAGLTGLAQVSGLRGDTPVSDRARFDNYYIENWSLWLDVKVLLRTVSEVVFFRGR